MGTSLLRVLKRACGWLSIGLVTGTICGFLWHLFAIGFYDSAEIAEWSFSEEKATYSARMAVRRVLSGALIGSAIGVLLEAAVNHKRKSRQAVSVRTFVSGICEQTTTHGGQKSQLKFLASMR